METRTIQQITDSLSDEFLAELEYNYSSDACLKIEIVMNFLNGDLNLEIAHLEGCSTIITKEGITSENPKCDTVILQRIADLMDSNEHMALFEKHGLFHDGGDEFDYSGSFYYDLITLMEYAFDLE